MRLIARPSPFLKPLLIELNCKTRILVVLDGLTFGSADFGISECLAIVEASGVTDHPVEITKAARGGDPDADVTSFTFDGTHTVDGKSRRLSYYEEIWILGIQGGGTLPVAERNAIESFMDDGGGVFATGDHNELGAFMSSEIKRVKSMRRWRNADGAPDGFNPAATAGGASGRIDTTVPNGAVISDFDLQEDVIPQRIYPRFYETGGVVSAHEVVTRHDVDGPITYLPDHPHEGLIIEPRTLDPEEFPDDVAPEIIAWGVSAGAGGKPAVDPKLFGVIGAYDGHQADVGRIVVDSTWHHFVNINLVGSALGAIPGAPTDGLTVGGVPTTEYEQIKDYFQNIAGWLEPNHARWCLYIPWWFTLVYASAVFEELLVIDEPDLPRLVELGALGRRSLSGRDYRRMLDLAVGGLDADDRARALLAPQVMQGKRKFRGFNRLSPLLDRQRFRDAVFGAVIWHLFAAFGRSPDEAVERLRKLLALNRDGHDVTGFVKLVHEGIADGLRRVERELGQANGGFATLKRSLPSD